MELKEFKESKLINSINNSIINCYERPIYIAIENMTQELVLYYLLLFKEAKTDMLDDEIRQHINNLNFATIVRKVDSIDSFPNSIIEAIRKNRCIILRVDLFYCKRYIYYYGKHHSAHNVLVKGFVESKNEMQIIDEQPEKINDYRSSYNPYYEQTISSDELKTMCLGIKEIDNDLKSLDYSCFAYNEISIDPIKQKIANLEEILALYEKMIQYYYKNYKLQIEKYCSYIQNFNDSINAGAYNNVKSLYPIPKELVPLFTHKDSLHIQKNVFNYVFNDTQLDNEFYNVISKYDILKNNFVKMLFSKRKSNNIEAAINFINEIATNETKLYATILKKFYDTQVIEIFRELKVDEPGLGRLEDSFVKAIGTLQCEFLNLSEYFNNKCFAFENDHIIMNEFVGNYERIIVPESISNRLIGNADIKFKMPAIIEQDFDNIVCKGQNINVGAKDSAKGIKFLLFAEWNDYTETIEIFFCDGDSESVLIMANDYAYSSINKEEVFWSGQKKQINKCIYSNVFLFAKVIKLNKCKPIQNIVLPSCVNIHIISITILH